MDTSSIDAGSRFLASTLHEIRTPIQTIIGTLDLLQDTPLNQEQTEYVRQIDFSANVLLQLANDVLDFTKIRAEGFKLENIPFNVIELTERVVDLISMDAFSRGVEIITDIDYSIPNEIMGDPTRLQQIILNLVKNAVKFTPKGYILVKVTMDNSNLLFEIIDSGIGVPEEKQPLIFNDFYQVDASTTRKYGGTGLGLSICKNLVSVMKGQIGVKSNPNGGSIFWFSIPVELPAAIPFMESKEVNFSSVGRVLLVDDSPIFLKSLKSKLQFWGIKEIDTATSGQEALIKISQADEQHNPYAVAFIDMVMPVMDGWRLAAEINDIHPSKDMERYLMIPEGQMGKDAKMKMLDWYTGYLYKPIKQANLEQMLQEFVAPPAELIQIDDDDTQVVPQPVAIPVTQDGDIAKDLKILIAEDHPVNIKLMDTFLKKFGATVVLAEDGQQAVDQIKANPDVDLIFMDIQMPVKNGTDATVELRQMGYKGIIVACTANDNQEDFEAYKKLGINDILVKPFKREQIKNLLEKWNAVLNVPEAKDILSYTNINSAAQKFWDVQQLMSNVYESTEVAESLVQEYLDQTTMILKRIKAELTKKDKNMEQLELLSHTLKGSSTSIGANKLAEYALAMNEAVKANDLIQIESSRTDFAIDFLEFKKVVKQWKETLED